MSSPLSQPFSSCLVQGKVIGLVHEDILLICIYSLSKQRKHLEGEHLEGEHLEGEHQNNSLPSMPLIGCSGSRSTGIHKFSANLDDDNMLRLSCLNSPDFFLLLTGFPQESLSIINSTIRGRCGTERGSQFILQIESNKCRIDCVDDLSFWVEFSFH
jgi:hypothetical protein